MPLMLVPVAYRIDLDPERTHEVDAWTLKDNDIASVKCPCPGCDVQYGLLFPFGASWEKKIAHVDSLIRQLGDACPQHDERVIVHDAGRSWLAEAVAV